MNRHDLLSTAGISIAVSSFVVLVNNYFFYRHCCPKQDKKNVEQLKKSEE